VTPSRRIRRSRDPDDDKFLECAVAGAAEWLVTASGAALTGRARATHDGIARDPAHPATR
jgi:predicted nucleic acid-binding protein